MAISKRITRRGFIGKTAATAAAAAFIPSLTAGCARQKEPMKRAFGKLNFEVTTLGLGGQSSLQWTPDDVDPLKIIEKAFELGINYFDTSNLYGPSQSYFGKVFKKLNLVPGEPGYNEGLRKSIFLTSKTHLRWAKGGRDLPGVNNWTNGKPGSHTVDDVRRSLSQMFGDGQGHYPNGAYLDMVLIHSLSTKDEVDAVFEGVDDPDPAAEHIGALAALRDLRDGSNLTGLNPHHERLIRHIGFSCHYDPAASIYMIQRDRSNLLEAMLVSINANDHLMFNMQHNVIPLAAAKNMGIIGMKVFADGAMYTKPANWSGDKRDVVRTVGSADIPSRPLVQYALTTPGVHTVIIGIGQISDKYSECQLCNNLDAAQVLPNGLTAAERAQIEVTAKRAKDGQTNYFQKPAIPLTAPETVLVEERVEDGARTVVLSWSTAYAADAPLKTYEIWRDGVLVAEVPFRPQLTTDPMTFTETLDDSAPHSYAVAIIDAKGRETRSETVTLV